jgi:ectoine hydroxylase-related dioxygenase (phytanoyl-CoA dioxygenase family)
MNNEWALLPMRASNDLLGDAEGLRARMDEDSYLYFEQVIDPAVVGALRADVLDVLLDANWIAGAHYKDHAVSLVTPLRENDEAFQEVYQSVQRLERFHTLAHEPHLLDIMRQVVGPTAFPHPLKIARLSFPSNFEVSTPPHQDFPNNQGSEALTASWIPVGDVPISMGGLAVLRGSHRYGVLPLDYHPGAGNRQALIPLPMREALRWVTTDFRAGDVLLFPSTTVHASLHNGSDSMRISVDFRYQVEGEPLTDVCLHPHFQSQSWEEIYAGWSSTEHQFYWRDLDYEVVPFEQIPLARGDAGELSEEDVWRHLLRQEARHNRRIERLAASGVIDVAP